MCGYSADAGFLNEAVERFTQKTTAQRAYEGRVSLALMLDCGNKQITPIAVPGLLHLPVRSVTKLPFKLLHAKVGILGFRHESDPNRWQIKLIVSTGNWTRSTLEDSLDLAWCTEIDSDDLKTGREPSEQSAVDITSAWKMIQWLTKVFDTRVLSPEPPESTGRVQAAPAESSEVLSKWLRQTQKFGSHDVCARLSLHDFFSL